MSVRLTLASIVLRRSAAMYRWAARRVKGHNLFFLLSPCVLLSIYMLYMWRDYEPRPVANHWSLPLSVVTSAAQLDCHAFLPCNQINLTAYDGRYNVLADGFQADLHRHLHSGHCSRQTPTFIFHFQYGGLGSLFHAKAAEMLYAITHGLQYAEFVPKHRQKDGWYIWESAVDDGLFPCHKAGLSNCVHQSLSDCKVDHWYDIWELQMNNNTTRCDVDQGAPALSDCTYTSRDDYPGLPLYEYLGIDDLEPQRLPATFATYYHLPKCFFYYQAVRYVTEPTTKWLNVLLPHVARILQLPNRYTPLVADMRWSRLRHSLQQQLLQEQQLSHMGYVFVRRGDKGIEAKTHDVWEYLNHMLIVHARTGVHTFYASSDDQTALAELHSLNALLPETRRLRIITPTYDAQWNGWDQMAKRSNSEVYNLLMRTNVDMLIASMCNVIVGMGTSNQIRLAYELAVAYSDTNSVLFYTLDTKAMKEKEAMPGINSWALGANRLALRGPVVCPEFQA